MSKKWLCLILIVPMIIELMVFGCNKKCTESKPPNKAPEWTTYNTSNSGLVNNSVQAIAIDAEGSFWFGTSGGGISKLSGGNWIEMFLS